MRLKTERRINDILFIFHVSCDMSLHCLMFFKISEIMSSVSLASFVPLSLAHFIHYLGFCLVQIYGL